MTREKDDYVQSRRDPKFLLKALKKQNLPDWLYLEIEEIVKAKRRKAPSRGKSSFEKREQQVWVNWVRRLAVERCKLEGVPPLEAWQAASDVLEGTLYQGSADTMERAWKKRRKIDERDFPAFFDRWFERELEKGLREEDGWDPHVFATNLEEELEKFDRENLVIEEEDPGT